MLKYSSGSDIRPSSPIFRFECFKLIFNNDQTRPEKTTPDQTKKYLGDILGVSGGYPGDILGVSWGYLEGILRVSWGYLGDILGIILGIYLGWVGNILWIYAGYLRISGGFLGNILGISWHILGISWGHPACTKPERQRGKGWAPKAQSVSAKGTKHERRRHEGMRKKKQAPDHPPYFNGQILFLGSFLFSLFKSFHISR